MRDARDIARSRVIPRFFAALEGDILSRLMVTEVVDGGQEGVGPSSSTSVLLSFNLSLLETIQSRNLGNAVLDGVNGMGLVRGITRVEGEVKLGVVSIDMEFQVVLVNKRIRVAQHDQSGTNVDNSQHRVNRVIAVQHDQSGTNEKQTPTLGSIG